MGSTLFQTRRLLIPGSESKPKRQVALLRKRHGHAVEMLEGYEDKLIQTARLLAKWRRRVAYYEKALGEGRGK
jgi:hypothetical protein